MASDDDSDAPEEFTTEQGIEQDKEITKVRRENTTRVAREGKERRRQWAQRKTQKKKPSTHAVAVKVSETELHQVAQDIGDMLPSNIVNLLAANEKKTFHSDSEDGSIDVKPTSKKKRLKNSGVEPVLLNDIPPPQCLQNSKAFIKKRKMQVSRSSSVLKNSKQALRLLTKTGLLSNT